VIFELYAEHAFKSWALLENSYQDSKRITFI